MMQRKRSFPADQRIGNRDRDDHSGCDGCLIQKAGKRTVYIAVMDEINGIPQKKEAFASAVDAVLRLLRMQNDPSGGKTAVIFPNGKPSKYG